MFRHAFACALGVSAGLATTTVASEPQALTGAAIRATVAGSTIRLDTPLAATVPIHYSESGEVTGEAGNLSWVLGAATDKGRWWVEKDRLCHKWSVWFEAENQCLRLSLEGDRVFWLRDDGKSGTATMIPRPQQADQSQTVAALVPVTPPLMAAPQLAQTTQVQKPAATIVAKPKITPPVKRQPASVSRTTQLAKTQSATSSVVIVPTFKVAGVDESDVLYVREGPSMDHASVGALPPRAQGVKILGSCQQTWCRIAHQGMQGWVNTYYLTAQDPVVAPPMVKVIASERR